MVLLKNEKLKTDELVKDAEKIITKQNKEILDKVSNIENEISSMGIKQNANNY